MFSFVLGKIKTLNVNYNNIHVVLYKYTFRLLWYITKRQPVLLVQHVVTLPELSFPV